MSAALIYNSYSKSQQLEAIIATIGPTTTPYVLIVLDEKIKSFVDALSLYTN